MPGRSLSAILAGFLVALSSCGSKNLPPAAGTIGQDDPEAAALYARAQAADQAGRSKKALKTYGKVADKYPLAQVAPDARFREAALLEHNGDLLKAFDAYQEMIKNYPGSPLYGQALQNQALVAHAAADGIIKNSFLGLKSRVAAKDSAEMLAKVRDNAPLSRTAADAQFAIGEVWERQKRNPEALEAFQKFIDDYPTDRRAPDAQYRIGMILFGNTRKGNQNQANLDKARYAFEDLIQRYPNSGRASDARARLAEIHQRDIQRSFDIAEFYYKKGETTSAVFYYQEVLRKVDRGTLHDQAVARLARLNGQ